MEFSFKAKKSKSKKFAVKEDVKEKKQETITTQPPKPTTKEEKKAVQSRKELFAALASQLFQRYNIDEVSIYSVSDVDERGRIYFHLLFGNEISKYVVERYIGYDCVVVSKNADGMVDNTSHRSRLIERFGNYLIVISSNSYEAYKDEYDLFSVRYIVKNEFQKLGELK